MCFVPEFLQLHILNEIDVDWGPKLWKKDQKLACYWEKCEYEVETRQKGARPLQRLKNHMKTHLGIKSYICTFCNGRYTNVTRLDDHFHRQQRGDKFQCDKCKRKFSTERNWNILVPVVLFLLYLSVFRDRCQIHIQKIEFYELIYAPISIYGVALKKDAFKLCQHLQPYLPICATHTVMFVSLVRVPFVKRSSSPAMTTGTTYNEFICC